MTDFAASAYQIETQPPGIMRGALAAGTVVGMSITPESSRQTSLGDPYNGSGVDLSVGSGMAFLVYGIIANSTPNLVSVQESDDQSTWTSITDGSVLLQTATASGYFNYHRTKRYIRAVFEHQNQTPTQAHICAIVGKQ